MAKYRCPECGPVYIVRKEKDKSPVCDCGEKLIEEEEED
jgi:predicted RNA-binding Zn-ribbon protein involved in translation (DUF1610 family)